MIIKTTILWNMKSYLALHQNKKSCCSHNPQVLLSLNLLYCFVFRSALPLVNNIDVVYIKIFLHAVGNNVYDIFMIGNSGQIFRFVFSYAVHVCCKLECYPSNSYGYTKLKHPPTESTELNIHTTVYITRK